MKKAFKIYKEGTTSDWITILIPEDLFSIEYIKLKAEKYLYLEYKVIFLF